MGFLIINFIEDLLPFERELLSTSVVAIDTETTGLDPHKNKIRLIQLAAEGMPVIVIDCATFLTESSC
ncbi:MAG: hypothetical protein Q8936_16300 [Bacillota bacterium]|nr:hypothetical protein [Bacillota bacterium]